VLLLAVTPWTATNADAQSLPAGWSVIDIGKPPSAGTAAFATPTLTQKSKGFDVNGTKDQFTFAYKSISGDVTLIARVATLSAADPASLAGLMIRTSSSATQRHVSVFATPSKGVFERHRASNGGSTTQTSGGSSTAPVWLKLERRSNTFTAYRSSTGTSWTAIRSVSLSLSSTAMVGFAVASHSTASSVTATFDSVSVNGTAWSVGNTPPAVSLTSPATGSSFSTPATIALAATASDSDGIAKVAFYNGATLLGTDTTSPYTFSWTGVAAGSYSVKAVATDTKGATSTTATASITVGTSANNAPNVSMTSPANGGAFVLPTSITMTATASDSDGSIKKVEFYLGTLLIGTDTTSPYSVIWPAVLGSYSVSAVATDNLGARTVSSWRDFVVTATPVLSKAVFRPASPADTVDYYKFEVFAAGANPNTAAPIATQNIGLPTVVSGECTANVQATILGLPAGNYIATVAGIGSGRTLRSNSFSFSR
jgi:regulation of enolase protein 1 (concanavalin A-like superfamily)